MNKSTRWTDEELIAAVAGARSKRQVMISLGLAPKGGNYATIDRAIKRLNLDTDHFLGQGWHVGRSPGKPALPLDEVMVNGKPYQSSRLRKRLLAEGRLPYECNQCKLTEWLNKPIPLELDHIDGVHDNNEFSNLRLLCPNCHAQTDTYRGKNRKS